MLLGEQGAVRAKLKLCLVVHCPGNTTITGGGAGSVRPQFQELSSAMPTPASPSPYLEGIRH